MNFHNLKTCFDRSLVADLKSVITFECQFYLMQEVLLRYAYTATHRVPTALLYGYFLPPFHGDAALALRPMRQLNGTEF
jgi:hypothetical protein